MADDRTRECPLCRELIDARALKCKHCGSPVAPTLPDHGGVCPFCRESIHPEALICRHCRSPLTAALTAAVTAAGTVSGTAAGTSVSSCGCAGSQGPSEPSSPEALRRPQCQSWCQGSTLMCACPVRVPGMGEGIVVYPCGTCIDDPIITALTSWLARR